KAHAQEKAELGRQLSENVASDLFVSGRQCEIHDPGGGFFDRKRRQVVYIFAGNFHIARVRAEARFFAGWTGNRGSVAAEHHTDMQLVALPFQVFEKLLYPLRGAFPLPDYLVNMLRQVLVGDREVDSSPLHGNQQLFLPPIAAGFAPGLNRTLGQRLAMVGNDKVWIVTENIAEPIAFGTGPEWMVKGKKDWTNRL